MEHQFFILREGQKRGPYTQEELQLMRIKPFDLIAVSENAALTEAKNVKELQFIFKEEQPNAQEENSTTKHYPVEGKVDQYNNSTFGFGSGIITFLSNREIKIEYPSEIIYYRYANFWERLVARILDTLIVLIPSFILPLVANWLYFALQQSGDHQQTLGQRALDIKLISANGRKVDFGQATGRFFGNFLNGLTLGIGFIIYFFSSRNQCLHDMLANTLVVSEIKREKN